MLILKQTYPVVLWQALVGVDASLEPLQRVLAVEQERVNHLVPVLLRRQSSIFAS
jgi:hypothetical protein